VLVFLDDERFVSSLIEVTLSNSFFHNVPASGMGISEPRHKLLHIAIIFWIQYQMPMIWHDAIS
jgi:hypothetical protein